MDYKGRIYIESISENQIFLLPDTNSIPIKGWAVSNDLYDALNLYVNDQFVETIANRTSREDVDTLVSPEYGGTENTPNAGFETVLDVSKFTKGAYKITIDEVSREGNLICSYTQFIEIDYTNYQGRMYIETPTENQNLQLPDNNYLNVQGWAVSNDRNAVLNIYLNDQYIKTIEKRFLREDVDNLVSPEYGGAENTPYAGFETELNIERLPEGTCKISIDEVSRYGELICSVVQYVKISYSKYQGRMYIETPTENQNLQLPDNNYLNVQGWAVSNDRNAVLNIYLNDQYIKTIEKRFLREDVDNLVSPEYGGAENTPYAGFETELNIERLPEGTCKISIDEVSRYGELICRTVQYIKIIHKTYEGTLYIDSPTESQFAMLPEANTLTVQGWAVSNDEAAYMLVYINGREPISFSTIRTQREDVNQLISPQYGGTETTPNAGFTMFVDISNLTDGVYDLTVLEVSRYHKIICQSTIKLSVVTPNYAGKMYVEAPVENRRYSSGRLTICGWALSEDCNDSVKVYLDGKEVAIAERREREDVLATLNNNEFGGRDSNPYPGFYSEIITRGLNEGMHTISIVNYSGYGKQIQSTKIHFMISNTAILGIDVSHHNGTINWQAVKNAGIDFAILKIGEYRESSGTIIPDDRFEEYYYSCKRLGIAVGGYFYSYAFNPTEAAHEADACSLLIKGKSFEMPIFMDLEDKIVTNAVNRGITNKDTLTNAVATFCDIMNSRGYQSGVYSYKNFFNVYLSMSVLERYNIWLAHYVSNTDYTGKYDMWQYTSSGRVPGISGAVDMNWCYRRYF